MSCTILGDSIAVGVHQYDRSCNLVGRVGISSQQFAVRYTILTSVNSTLISLGSNDGSYDSLADLRLIRSRISSRDVLWLVPANNRLARENVLTIVREYRDRTIFVSDYVGRDGVHPNTPGYQEIARTWR